MRGFLLKKLKNIISVKKCFYEIRKKEQFVPYSLYVKNKFLAKIAKLLLTFYHENLFVK